MNFQVIMIFILLIFTLVNLFIENEQITTVFNVVALIVAVILALVYKRVHPKN